MSKEIEYGTKDYSLGWMQINDFDEYSSKFLHTLKEEGVKDLGVHALMGTLSALRNQIEYLTLKVANLEKKAQIYQETEE